MNWMFKYFVYRRKLTLLLISILVSYVSFGLKSSMIMTGVSRFQNISLSKQDNKITIAWPITLAQ